MNELDNFEVIEDRAVFRPAGQMTLHEAVRLVTAAITFTREQGIRKLLIVASGVTGFESPSLSSRYFFMQEWAQAAGGVIRIAMVVRPEMIDPQKFGVNVGTRNGLISDVFDSELDALAWLK